MNPSDPATEAAFAALIAETATDDPSSNGSRPTLAPSFRSTRLADVEPERVTWLWPRRLPRGKLVTLDGDPDVGKSTLALDWCALITTAQPFPGEDLACVPASDVVLMAAEDGLADTIRPRLDVAGADVTRVHHFDAVARVDDDGNTIWVPPSIPEDLPALEALILATGAVLVVIDVLMAYLSGRADSHRDQDVRRALLPLAELADRTGACIILVRHLRKSRGSAMYAGGGSIGIVGSVRSGMVAAAALDDESGRRRVLARTKGNLAEGWSSLAYIITADDPMGPARVEWLGEVDTTADALMAFPDGEERSKLQSAKALLTERLSAVCTLSRELEEEAREALDVSRRTLITARQELGVVAFQRGKQWRLKLPTFPCDASGCKDPCLHSDTLTRDAVGP